MMGIDVALMGRQLSTWGMAVSNDNKINSNILLSNGSIMEISNAKNFSGFIKPISKVVSISRPCLR